MVKRYLAEPGTADVERLIASSTTGSTSRIAYVEVMRAIELAGARARVDQFERDWRALEVVEVDDGLTRIAARLAVRRGLRGLDALHLAAALTLPRLDLVVAVWDRRLHAAARAEGLRVAPEALA